jgi:hypothetical protein
MTMSDASSAAAWSDVVAACLLGQDRAPVPQIPPALANAIGDAEGDLMTTLAGMTVYRTAGLLFDRTGVTPLPDFVGDGAECSRPAAEMLHAILAPASRIKNLLGEWCLLASRKGLQVPAEFVPRLLLQIDRSAAWHAAAEQVLGPRGEWFRSLDAKEEAPAAGSAEAWTTGDLPARIAALEAIRRRDSVAAREALAAVRREESADLFARLMGALEVNLSMHDEPFLEEMLDDRSTKVRSAAASHLCNLPQSRFAERMRERTSRLITCWHGALRVSLPEHDPSMSRDGLPEAGVGQRQHLLLAIVSCTPICAWAQNPPHWWVEQAIRTEWSESLLRGWLLAASRASDETWVAAIADAIVSQKSSGRNRGINSLLLDSLNALPPTARERIVEHAIANLPAESAINCLETCVHAWSPAFTRTVFGWLRERMQSPDASRVNFRSARLLDLVAFRADPEHASDTLVHITENAPDRSRKEIEDFAHILTFRAEMRKELLQ